MNLPLNILSTRNLPLTINMTIIPQPFDPQRALQPEAFATAAVPHPSAAKLSRKRHEENARTAGPAGTLGQTWWFSGLIKQPWVDEPKGLIH